MSWLVFLAAIAVSVLIFGWLVNILKATIRTALSVAVLVLALLIFFGIGPDQVFQQAGQILQNLLKLITGGR